MENKTTCMLRLQQIFQLKISFNEYSSKVSKEMLEETCFVSILKALRHNKGFLYFDDGTVNIPDAYYRNEHIIYLFEFKAYILKDELIEKPDFDNIKKYVDEHFIGTPDGKPKGIRQLIR